MANNKNKKKVVIDFTKKEKIAKSFLLLDVNLHDLENNMVDGFEYSGRIIKKFGKSYYEVKNKVISL